MEIELKKLTILIYETQEDYHNYFEEVFKIKDLLWTSDITNFKDYLETSKTQKNPLLGINISRHLFESEYIEFCELIVSKLNEYNKIILDIRNSVFFDTLRSVLFCSDFNLEDVNIYYFSNNIFDIEKGHIKVKQPYRLIKITESGGLTDWPSGFYDLISKVILNIIKHRKK